MTMLNLDVIGTIAASATDTGETFYIANAAPPITVVVGYTSVNAATVTVTVESSLDGGVTWASPGLVAGSPTTSIISEAITGNGSYLIYPILVALDPGGAGTTDIPGHIGPHMRVKILNGSGATAITNVRVAIMCG